MDENNKNNTWSWDDTMWGGESPDRRDEPAGSETGIKGSAPANARDTADAAADTGRTESRPSGTDGAANAGAAAAPGKPADVANGGPAVTAQMPGAEKVPKAAAGMDETAQMPKAAPTAGAENRQPETAQMPGAAASQERQSAQMPGAAAKTEPPRKPVQPANEGFDASNPSYYAHEPQQRKPQRAYAMEHKHYLTRGVFIIILIIAMLVTMLGSVGGTLFFMNQFNKTNNEATNYTLTTSDETLSYKSIIQKAEPSVVSITTESVANDIWAQNYVTQGAGSGVIVTKDGYIITCHHVISGASKITVTLENGKEYKAEVIGSDTENDIAVIKIKAKGLTPATYGDSSKLEVGDQVVAIGNPLGSLSGTATTGIISALNRNLTIEDMTLNLFQTDASINPGNSGGGMFDQAGNLIGIVEAKSTGSDIDGLGFATPINKAAKIAKKIIKSGGSIGDNSLKDTPDAVIGVMVREVAEDLAQQYGYSHGGLLVQSITNPAARMAGLSEGDIIYKADGKTISKQEDLTKVLAKKKVGDKVKLSVAGENGRDAEITTTLISSKQAQ